MKIENKKQNIILPIVVCIFFIFLILFTTKKENINLNNQEFLSKNVLTAKYAKILPEIKILLKKELNDQIDLIDLDQYISISKEVDINNDGNIELLISLGPVGATGEAFSIVSVNENNLTVLKIEDRVGSISNFSASISSGGGGKYVSDIEIIEKEHLIKTTNYSVYGNDDDHCNTNVFIWNKDTKLYEYNKNKSDLEKNKLMKICLEIASSTGVKYEVKKVNDENIEDLYKWASEENGLPKGWVRWNDKIGEISVEKYGPSKNDLSYMIHLDAKIIPQIKLEHKCMGDSESATCAIGNDPEVLKYNEIINYKL
jgi:hypothetical protein